MPRRHLIFTNGEYYHIFNRGVNKRPIFEDARDYHHFLLIFKYYQWRETQVKFSLFRTWSVQDRQTYLQNLIENGNRLVTPLCFTLMPNHFHLLLKQEFDEGTTIYLRKLQNSYSHYENTRHRRIGPLFQGVFRAVHIESDEQLLHIARYIHLNPLTSNLVRDFDELQAYPWSSLKQYLETKGDECDTQFILSHFKSKEAYKKFVADQAEYQKTLEDIKHLKID